MQYLYREFFFVSITDDVESERKALKRGTMRQNGPSSSVQLFHADDVSFSN